MKRKGTSAAGGSRPAGEPVVGVRIIGGSLRGRTLQYSGDARTRPMKDRVREAVFNLVGPRIVGMWAVDLFAGTGALGLEALSRGAVRATLIERHHPTAQLIERNAATLGIGDKVEVIFSDAFHWTSKLTPSFDLPIAVFCSPPYEFYESRREEMVELVRRFVALTPPASLFVVEADEQFDFSLLPDADQWDVRTYPPAVVGLYEKS
jgi:16S rRNA (guanine966-N2)-methyltransferase